MFRVLNTSTSELAIALDYYTPEQLEVAFRVPTKDGLLQCPVCRTTVALRREFDGMPHFLHAKDSACPHANEDLSLLKLRAVLYRHLRREFGHGVTVEHDLMDKRVPRSVDCWVESGGKKFGYWIVDGEVKSAKKRKAMRSAVEAEGAACHFVFAHSMLPATDESLVKLGETEKFAKACTQYDVLDGKNEGGTLHYLSTEGVEPELITFRTLLAKEEDVFSGVQKKDTLTETEVCSHTGRLVHPGERTHAEIVRTRKAREQFEAEATPDHPEALKRKQWELETRRMKRSGNTFQQMIARILRPRPEQPTIEMWQDKEAPCEFCGVVTRDWIVYTGKTGKCKCRACYDRISAEKWRKEHPNWTDEDGKVA
jgi:hypothetical protein